MNIYADSDESLESSATSEHRSLIRTGWLVVAAGFLLALASAATFANGPRRWESLASTSHRLGLVIMLAGSVVLLATYRWKLWKQQQAARATGGKRPLTYPRWPADAAPSGTWASGALEPLSGPSGTRTTPGPPSTSPPSTSPPATSPPATSPPTTFSDQVLTSMKEIPPTAGEGSASSTREPWSDPASPGPSGAGSSRAGQSSGGSSKAGASSSSFQRPGSRPWEDAGTSEVTYQHHWARQVTFVMLILAANVITSLALLVFLQDRSLRPFVGLGVILFSTLLTVTFLAGWAEGRGWLRTFCLCGVVSLLVGQLSLMSMFSFRIGTGRMDAVAPLILWWTAPLAGLLGICIRWLLGGADKR